MIERLETIKKRYEEIEQELTNPEIISNIKKMTELSKEQTRLGDIVELYTKYKNNEQDIEAAKEMLKDKDMMEYARDLADAASGSHRLRGLPLPVLLRLCGQSLPHRSGYSGSAASADQRGGHGRGLGR